MTGAQRQANYARRHRIANLRDLAVECWCQTCIVDVAPELVRRGETLSCGAPNCRPQAVAS